VVSPAPPLDHAQRNRWRMPPLASLPARRAAAHLADVSRGYAFVAAVLAVMRIGKLVISAAHRLNAPVAVSDA
jgi:hypothetical protein